MQDAGYRMQDALALGTCLEFKHDKGAVERVMGEAWPWEKCTWDQWLQYCSAVAAVVDTCQKSTRPQLPARRARGPSYLPEDHEASDIVVLQSSQGPWLAAGHISPGGSEEWIYSGGVEVFQ